MRAFFAVVFKVGAVADESLASATRPSTADQSHLFDFDVCILTRGINAVKSARVLCEEGQWEFAVGVVRQLFELVLNMEHLATYDDRLEGTLRYTKYGLMQSIERERDRLIYRQRSGSTTNEERLLTLENSLENMFPEFRTRTPKGRLDRKQYWSGRTVRKLAQESPHRLRVPQYDLLFTSYSEEAHAAPGALIASMLPRSLSRDALFANDSGRIADTLMMGVQFFFELWALLPNVPQASPEQKHALISAMVDEATEFGSWPTAPLDNAEEGILPPDNVSGVSQLKN